MKTNYLLIVLLFVFLAACKHDRKTMLVGRWHVVKFENNLQLLTGKWDAISVSNPEMDSFFKKGQLYIDTVGRHNDAATNLKLYGVTNMDSMRIELQKQFDTARNMQMMAVSNTSFVFSEDGTAYLSFNGKIDSSSWYIDSTGILVLDDLNEESKGQKLNLEIVSVTDTALTLKFRENNSFSIVTFHPDGKKDSKTEPMVETWFKFRKDGVAELTFNKVSDSARWSMDNDSVVTVKSMDKQTEGELMKWDILAMDETKLVLKIKENSSVSTLTFKREEK